MTLADLGYKSIRRNALIADMLHRIEFIEKAGTGIKRIRDDARDHGCPEPRFEETGFVTATFYPNSEVRAQATVQVGNVKGAAGAQSGAQSNRVLRALSDGVGSAQELATTLGLRSKTGALKRTLNELLGNGLIELTIPDKPSSRLQRYRITPHGLEALKKNKETK